MKSRTKLDSRKHMPHSVVDQLDGGVWRLWLHTIDYKYGTYALLHPNGDIVVETEETDGIRHIWAKEGED